MIQIQWVMPRYDAGMFPRLCTLAFAISLLVFAVLAAVPGRNDPPAHRAESKQDAPGALAKVTRPAMTSPTTLPRFQKVIRDVAALVLRIANDQMRWGIWRETDGSLGPLMNEPAELSGPSEQLGRIYHEDASFDEEYGVSPKRLAYPLLAALDKPDQFVVAHLLLVHLSKAWHTTVTERADGKFVENLDGLQILLAPQGEPPISSSGRIVYPDCIATVDPSQMAKIKRQWLHLHAQQDGPSE
jgi:hypothetical protein